MKEENVIIAMETEGHVDPNPDKDIDKSRDTAECEDKVAPIAIESKALLDQDYPDFVEKYFSRHYCNGVKDKGDDYCVLVRIMDCFFS